MSKCECTMAIRVNGDGCRYCQPQGCIDRLIDWINEAKEEITALAKERKDLEYRLSEAEARIAELEIKESMYDEHSDAVKKCLALNKQLVATENGLRWVCNVYMVDDDYTGDLRKERLERAVKYAMKKGRLKEANGGEG